MRRPATTSRLDFIGRDVAGSNKRLRRRLRESPALLAVLLLAALAIAALRVDLIRVRYGLAEALSEEKALLEQRRESLARLRTLRDPARLASLAAEFELARPVRIIDLVELPVVSAPAEASR